MTATATKTRKTPTKDEYLAAARVEHRGYGIVVKRDFGGQWHWIDGMPCMWGYVVVDKNGCNAMPGATWFQTVKEAKDGIDDLIHCERVGIDFWKYTRHPDHPRHAR